MACAHAIRTESSSAALVVVACIVVEAAQGTPIKNKLNPLVGLPASDQEVEVKARSSRFCAFCHLLGGGKLML